MPDREVFRQPRPDVCALLLSTSNGVALAVPEARSGLQLVAKDGDDARLTR
jgi:hypothetical protein